ncbi:hypothetical protein [Actinoplanes derwentensis]|uniref:Uncharacterized protein n=1 Tax=Actinoplanes derwentensis TaxID=113562 RepID=A0A1H1RUX5_9ACTN|nr:hypothetical protein [Actinoplanes derwentensis]GID84531.1 hypothetical protein Ade03nite_34550 [Actinoplanes derwentensis]SDS39567.1 hypothetical protein SAMN04489716_0694 [Actinoplanes derwentensis]
MVQATTPVQDSGQNDSSNGFRVGTKRDEATSGVASPTTAGRSVLPPIEWTHVDRGKILREDLLGVGGATTAIMVGLTVFIATAMGIALVLTTVLTALGFEFSSLY